MQRLVKYGADDGWGSVYDNIVSDSGARMECIKRDCSIFGTTTLDTVA